MEKVKTFVTIKNIAKTTLLFGLLLLLFYCYHLCKLGYINPMAPFSLDRAKDIAPFVGSFIAVFFSLGATLLVFENLRIQAETNAKNQLLVQKNQFEGILFNLFNLQNQISREFLTDVYVSYKAENEPEKDMKGKQLFDCLAPSIAYEFKKGTVKTLSELIRIYQKNLAVHSSELPHYFRHLYYIAKYIDSNNYFEFIAGKPVFLQKPDYMKTLRAQLTNTELVCLALNGLSPHGRSFQPLIEQYKLLKNILFDFHLATTGHENNVPASGLLCDAYPHLKVVYEQQKKEFENERL